MRIMPVPKTAPTYIVTRALCIGGNRVEVGTRLDGLGAQAAAEMLAAGKLAVAPAQAMPTPKPDQKPKPNLGKV